MKSILIFFSLLAVSCGNLVRQDVVVVTNPIPEPKVEDVKSTPIEGQYIVKLDSNSFSEEWYSPAGVRVVERLNQLNSVVVQTQYPRELFVEGVAYVEQDQTVASYEVQTEFVDWGLDRIDAESGLDKKYEYNYTGEGVSVYVIDTGIDPNHIDYSARLEGGFSVVGGSYYDCVGHGTHVAGTIAGSWIGVAKRASLYSVRALDCNGRGSMSGIAKAIDQVIAEAKLPAVINMSLGGGYSRAVNEAVDRAVAAGIPVVVAAGNSNDNACNSSPSSAPRAITVGSTDRRDRRSSFSNWGSCVDIFAPGSSIRSAKMGSTDGTTIKSGTSMASPHVAGVVALILDQVPDATPEEVELALRQWGTKGALSGIGQGSPNLLLRSRTN